MASIRRNAFTFVFTIMLAAVFFIVTGLIGYQPPARLSLDASTWRSGIWTGEVIIGQVALGVALLVVAGIAARRINRRLAAGRG